MSDNPIKKWLRTTGYTCGVFFCIFGFIVAVWYRSERPVRNLNVCISNLKQIYIAKAMLTVELGLKKGDLVSTGALEIVLKEQWPLKCPSGGIYSVNPIGTNPSCSYPRHSLQ